MCLVSLLPRKGGGQTCTGARGNAEPCVAKRPIQNVAACAHAGVAAQRHAYPERCRSGVGGDGWCHAEQDGKRGTISAQDNKGKRLLKSRPARFNLVASYFVIIARDILHRNHVCKVGGQVCVRAIARATCALGLSKPSRHCGVATLVLPRCRPCPGAARSASAVAQALSVARRL